MAFLDGCARPVAHRASELTTPISAAPQFLSGLLGSVVKDQELVRRKSELGVCLTLVVGEFDFVGAVQQLHDGADFAAQEAVCGHVCEESDDIQQVWRGVHCCRLYFTKQLVKRGALSPPHDPGTPDDPCALKTFDLKLYHLAIAELVGR